MITKESVLSALSEVFDPEIPINIVDMGLIYGIDVSGDRVHVKMTLTNPGCPMSRVILDDAKNKVMEKTGSKDVEMELVWEPKWTPDRISEDGKKKMEF